MACDRNLFDQLTGATSGGFWVLATVNGVAPNNLVIDLAGDDGAGNALAYNAFNVTDATTHLDPTTGANNWDIWFKPNVDDFAFPCNQPINFVFHYDVDTVCGDPPIAVVTWSVVKVCAYTEEEVDVCQNGSIDLLTTLRDAQGIASPNWIPSGGTWTWDPLAPNDDDPLGGFTGGSTFNPNIPGTGDYRFTYTWDVDGPPVVGPPASGDCASCIGTQHLIIHVQDITGAGTGSSITTCV